MIDDPEKHLKGIQFDDAGELVLPEDPDERADYVASLFGACLLAAHNYWVAQTIDELSQDSGLNLSPEQLEGLKGKILACTRGAQFTALDYLDQLHTEIKLLGDLTVRRDWQLHEMYYIWVNRFSRYDKDAES